MNEAFVDNTMSDTNEPEPTRHDENLAEQTKKNYKKRLQTIFLVKFSTKEN